MSMIPPKDELIKQQQDVHVSRVKTLTEEYNRNLFDEDRRYNERVIAINGNYEWQAAINSNLLPDLPYTEIRMRGNDNATTWQIDRAPVHIVAYKTNSQMKLYIHWRVVNTDAMMIIMPPIPRDVYVQVAYQFDPKAGE